MRPKASDRELYDQAIEQLETAVNELDQAHATLRDISLQDTVVVHTFQRDITIAGIFRLASALLDRLKQVECDTCLDEISRHPLPDCPHWQ